MDHAGGRIRPRLVYPLMARGIRPKCEYAKRKDINRQTRFLQREGTLRLPRLRTGSLIHADLTHACASRHLAIASLWAPA